MPALLLAALVLTTFAQRVYAAIVHFVAWTLKVVGDVCSHVGHHSSGCKSFRDTE